MVITNVFSRVQHYTSKTPWTGNVESTWSDDALNKSKDTVVFDKGTACKFELTNEGGLKNPGVFASSGVFVVRGNNNLAVGFPEQSIPLADLAGTWNALQYQKDVNNWINKQYIFTMDANGNMTNLQDCSGTTQATDVCSPIAANQGPKALVVNTKGGFDQVNQSDVKTGHRLFAYRNASGELMMVSTGSNSGSAGPGMLIATKKRALTLPKINEVNKYLEIQAYGSNNGLVSLFSSGQNTVKSVDSSNNSITRVRDFLDGVADGRVDTLNYSQPREGLRYRPASSYVKDGINYPTSSAVYMNIKDMGLTVTTGTGSSTTAKFLSLSVIMP